MPVVPVPYDAKNTPKIEFAEYNGARFKTVEWPVPEGVEYKGKVVYVHGFAEEANVYTEFFDNLSNAGYEVFFFEQRGAGEGSPGKLRGRTDEFHTFDDLDHFIKQQLDKRTDKSEKFYLGGHSMGGGIVLNYGIRGTYKDDIKGYFACGPLIRLHPKSQPNIILNTLAPFAAKVLPNFQIDSKLNYDYITSSPRWKKYIEDSSPKLIGTTRQFNDMFERGKHLLDPEYANKFKFPLLIVHGTEDYINDIAGSEEFYNSLKDKTGKKFVRVEKGRHSLFVEVESIYQDVLNQLLEFLAENK